MIRIVKWLLIAGVLAAFSSPNARANTLNAPSCSQSDVQAAINSASNGDTVVVPAGNCPWSSQVTILGKALTFQGATVCTGSGDPAQNNLACVDNTNITLTYGAGTILVNASAANFVRITGFTFTDGTGGESNGVVTFQSGPFGQVAYRFDHNHLKSNSGGAFVKLADSYGLADHNLLTETGNSGMNPPFVIYGDGASRGYQGWNAPTLEGSNQAVYLEQNTYNSNHIGTEGFYDAYAGAKIVARFNSLVNAQDSGGHGTDSGQYRSTVLTETYGNTFTNTAGIAIGSFTVRGGVTIFWGNTFTGTSSWTGVSLGYFRLTLVTDSYTWGSAVAGLRWVPLSTTPTDINSDENVLVVSPWAASQSYAAGASIGPTSNNAHGWNYFTASSCTSGGSTPSWNQNVGGTTVEGSCTWTNVGGTNAAPGAATAGWCAGNPDTMASSDSVCNALQPGDTATRYFDCTTGAGACPGNGYPFRDQPGFGHNQVSFPNYEWLNTGSEAPSEPILSPAAGTSSIIQANRDYFNYTASFTGAAGVGSGTLASRPSTCTTGVAYWATDQGSWNVSGNGSGQGVLYQCAATNAWSVYYTPYTYPYPVTQTTGSGPAPPTNVEATVIQ